MSETIQSTPVEINDNIIAEGNGTELSPYVVYYRGSPEKPTNHDKVYAFFQGKADETGGIVLRFLYKNIMTNQRSSPYAVISYKIPEA